MRKRLTQAEMDAMQSRATRELAALRFTNTVQILGRAMGRLTVSMHDSARAFRESLEVFARVRP